jgi:hypothetical protein
MCYELCDLDATIEDCAAECYATVHGGKQAGVWGV